MSPFILMVGLASASVHAAPGCDRFLVEPTPEQGWSDAALVTKASHHATASRDLGTALAGLGWRIVWARPADSEGGVFFFRGPRGSERLVDIWGGSGASRAEASTLR